MPSYDNKVLTGDQLVYFSGLVKTALANKADSSALTGKQDALVFNTAYDASTNKVATMSDVNNAASSIKISDVIAGQAATSPTSDPEPYYLDFVLDDMDMQIRGKQDKLVFNTAYNEETNKVATMADIPTTTEYTADLSQTMSEGVSITSKLTATDGISSAISNSGSELYKLTVSAFGMKGYDNLHSQEVNVGISNFIWKDNANSKQVSLTPGSNYDGLYVNGNKVATVADVNTAIGGVSSFSFEIVSSLPSTGNSSKIYLVAKSSSGTNQVYTEYIYVNNAWEIIGDTSMTIDTLTNQEVATIWGTATATT